MKATGEISSTSAPGHSCETAVRTYLPELKEALAALEEAQTALECNRATSSLGNPGYGSGDLPTRKNFEMIAKLRQIIRVLESESQGEIQPLNSQCPRDR